MKKETLNAIVNAFNCASIDPTRPQINGVLIRPHYSMVEIIATTGAGLSKNVVDDKEFNEKLMAVCSKGVYLPGESVKALKAVKVKTPGVMSSLDNKTLSLTFNGLTTAVLSVPQNVELAGDNAHLIYPDVDRVIPNYSENKTVKIGFDADLLSKIVDALKESKKSNGRVIFEIPMISETSLKVNRDKPYLIKLGNGMELGVLMPTRF